MKIEELELHRCRGEISTLMSRASNLKKLTLSGLDINAAIAATFKIFPPHDFDQSQDFLLITSVGYRTWR